MVCLALFACIATRAPAPGGDATPGRAKAADEREAAVLARDLRPFLEKNCFACHGREKQKGDLSLEAYKDAGAIREDRDVWEEVIRSVQTGEMPPKNRPRPDAEQADAAIRAVDELLARVDCSDPREVGRVTIRRLNRIEYNNTIRDLVGVDFKPAADFPNDDVGYGFDNIGDVLSLSPLLLERYLSAAESILDRAIVTYDPPKPSKIPLGGLRANFGEGGPRKGGGTFVNHKAEIYGQNYFDEGDYTIRAEVFGQQVGDEPVRASLRVDGEDVETFEVTATEQEPMKVEARVRLRSGTRRLAVAFLNPFDANHPDGPPRNVDPINRRNNFIAPAVVPDKDQRVLVVRGTIVAEGPFNPPPPTLPESHRRIMAHRPDVAPREAAREIVANFAALAFRRPVKAEEVDKLLKLYDNAEAEGERFEDRVRLALQGVLVWPDFLFRIERDPAGVPEGTAYPIGEFELASRLSYFLWSSMPDAELLRLAAEGRLRADLKGQVGRMLLDPKSSAFVQNFVGQWLTTRKLAYVNPDAKTFPDFDEGLRASMVRETELFFEAVLREGRSLLDLLDADFSFVDARLAKHYGIDGVEGPEFRRVKLPPNRGGILTQASVLTLTSNPTRTSPVKRGKWVLDQILDTPPPPPPPDVPDLAEEKQLTGSLRKVMEMHRESPLCASCHNKMDPIGFAFENYDAVGAWRDKDGAFDIDPSGTLPDGRSFRGPAELKAILRGQKDTFARCLTEKVLTYALGRGLEHYDRCAVDGILKMLDKDDHKLSALVLGVVESEPFQMRTSTGENP